MVDEELLLCPSCGSDDMWLISVQSDGDVGVSYSRCASCGVMSAIQFNRQTDPG